MHTYIMYFQRVCCWLAEAFDLGFVRGRAVRRRHCVGGAPAVSKYRGAVARRRWRKVFDLRILTWGFVRGRALRRLHCVGGCAPVNFGRRRRATRPKKSAARGVIVIFIGGRGEGAGRRGGGAGGGAAAPKNVPKNFVLSSKFSDYLFLGIGKCNKHGIAVKFSAAARRSPKVGGGAHKLTAAARRAHGST